MSNGTNSSGLSSGGRGTGSSGAAGGGGGSAGGATPSGIGVAAVSGPQVAAQAPSPSNVPITPGGATTLSQMSDDQLTTLYRQSRNVDMPNHLSDVDDKTQKFVFAAGINAKPTVLDTAAYNQFLQANNIPKSDQLARSTGGANYSVNGTNIRLSPQQVTAMIKDGDLNYIGGKWGGNVHGSGTYFDMNGGRPTGYNNGATCIGVLNPKTARPISDGQLRSRVSAFQRSHPKFSAAVGQYSYDTMSIYALAMGYNVITAGSYHNVIDRSAIVMRADDY